MKIISSNNNFLEFANIVNDGANVNLDVAITLKNDETDTNMGFSTHVSILPRDLQYIHESLELLVKRESTGFGFTSMDKTLSLWINREDMACEVELHDVRHKSQFMSQGRFYFPLSQESLPLMCDNIAKCLIQGRKDQVSVKESDNLSFSMYFPRIKEYVDDSLCVCEIAVDSPYYHINRNFDSSPQEISSFITNISDIKNEKIMSFQILGDFMEIELLRCDDSIDIQGVVSDFTWPEPNEIKFHEFVELNMLDRLFDSLKQLGI